MEMEIMTYSHTREVSERGRGRGRGRNRVGRGRGRGNKNKNMVGLFQYAESESEINVAETETQLSIAPFSSHQQSDKQITNRAEFLNNLPHRIFSSITFTTDRNHSCYNTQQPLRFISQNPNPESQGDHGVEASLPPFSSSNIPKHNDGFVLNAGGSVWAIDWCPTNADNHPQYIAIGAHPPDSPFHTLGLPLSGKGAVQIWSISISPCMADLPTMVMCLEHDGQVVWDLKWRPLIKNGMPQQHSLGSLAVLLGDGSLQVWEVPSPSVPNYMCNNKSDPRFVRLEPVFTSSKLKRQGQPSIPLTLEWSTAAPHDMILVGCHDGTVAAWKFFTCLRETKPVVCFVADSLAIRTLAWAPWGGDTESSNIVATGGHNGNLRLWDLREPYHPLWELNVGRGHVLSLDWVDTPNCIVLSMDDGALRILNLTDAFVDTPATGMPYSGTQFQGLQSYCCSSFALWSVHVCRNDGIVACCGIDGSVMRFQLSDKMLQQRNRKRVRPPYYMCGSFCHEEETGILDILTPSVLTPLHVKAPSQCTNTNLMLVEEEDDTPNKPSKASHSKEDSRCLAKFVHPSQSMDDAKGSLEKFPPKQNAVYRVRWNLNKGSETWLCYGGASGIVRCQKFTPLSLI